MGGVGDRGSGSGVAEACAGEACAGEACAGEACAGEACAASVIICRLLRRVGRWVRATARAVASG
jgi:hypothetical protein